MGKVGKWFRSLWSSNNKKSKLFNSGHNSGKLKNHADDPWASPYVNGIDANKRAIAVAAATAAVAEAALAAAQAAAEVVRLTTSGRSGRGSTGVSPDRRLVLAAIRIQSAFRAYLARRALKALKGLVKLQALVRGHIVRKQSSDMLRRMQAMARIQARASEHRSESPYSKTNFSNTRNPALGNPRKYKERSNSVENGGSLRKINHSRSRSGVSVNKETSEIASRWLNHWMEQCAWENVLDDTSLENDKILEVDTWIPHQTRNDRNTPTPQHLCSRNGTGPDYTKIIEIPSKHHKPNPSISSEDIPSVVDQVPARTADNSPRVHSASCRPSVNAGVPSFTPARSECSRSLLGDYICHPNYMTNTESSRAKVRSHSAPKQRMQPEELGLSRDIWDNADTISGRVSFSPANDRSGTYRYSGQVKRQGTPARDAGVGFSSIYGRRI